MAPWSYYRVCGLTLKADIPFPEIQISSPQRAECTLAFSRHIGEAIADADWLYKSLLPNGEPLLLVGQSKAGLLIRFPRLADFMISPAGNKISYLARRKTPKNTIRHFFLDYVLPSFLGRERLVLHASAVRVTDKSAIAFLGRSGSGKSTLATCFWKEGFQVIADDCTVVEQGNGFPMCIPSYPGVRLWNDSAKAVLSPWQKRSALAHYTNKSRFKHPNMEDEFGRPLRLSRIYWLKPAVPGKTQKITIRPIPGSQGLVKLLESSFRLDFKGAKPLTEEFHRLVKLADAKMLYAISFPRDFRRVGELTRAILDDIGH